MKLFNLDGKQTCISVQCFSYICHDNGCLSDEKEDICADSSLRCLADSRDHQWCCAGMQSHALYGPDLKLITESLRILNKYLSFAMLIIVLALLVLLICGLVWLGISAQNIRENVLSDQYTACTCGHRGICDSDECRA